MHRVDGRGISHNEKSITRGIINVTGLNALKNPVLEEGTKEDLKPSRFTGTLRKHDGNGNGNATKKKTLDEQNESLSTCVSNFGTFLSRSLQN